MSGLALARFAVTTATAKEKDGTNPKPSFRVTRPMPLDPMLAQTYASIRMVSKAYEAYTPDMEAQVIEGDMLEFQGDGRMFIVIAVEKWVDANPHVRLVLEER